MSVNLIDADVAAAVVCALEAGTGVYALDVAAKDVYDTFNDSVGDVVVFYFVVAIKKIDAVAIYVVVFFKLLKLFFAVRCKVVPYEARVASHTL